MSSDHGNVLASHAIPMIAPEYLPSVLASACDIALVVSTQGFVQAVLVNDLMATFGNLDHWRNRPLSELVTSDSAPKLEALLERVAEGEELPKRLELNHADGDAWKFPIRYTVHLIGHEGALLLLGRDLRQVAETQQQLVQAQMALERGYEEWREYNARYRMLMSSTRDAFVLVSVSDGKIRDLNAAAASLLGSEREELQGATFAQEFKDRRRTEFVENLLSLALSEVDMELTVLTRANRRSVAIVPFLFRAAGERLLFCRMDHEETAHLLDSRLTTNLNALFRHGSDAIVFTDPKGVIESANEAFVDMIDYAAAKEITGRSLADYLARGQIDMSVLLENALRSGHMRVYSTKLTNDLGGWTSVEISVSYLNNRARPCVAFLIRDASRAEAMRTNLHPQSDDAINHNVAELVGSASLKEIVTETSDVIEKMCIETAVELTRNNRAAAAEMLGLSRQSLYVKLRKYDLINNDSDS